MLRKGWGRGGGYNFINNGDKYWALTFFSSFVNVMYFLHLTAKCYYLIIIIYNFCIVLFSGVPKLSVLNIILVCGCRIVLLGEGRGLWDVCTSLLGTLWEPCMWWCIYMHCMHLVLWTHKLSVSCESFYVPYNMACKNIFFELYDNMAYLYCIIKIAIHSRNLTPSILFF